MTAQSLSFEVTKVSPSSTLSRSDAVAVEEPLEIRLGFNTAAGRTSQPLSITMRTPGNDEELAAGFLLSESIVKSAAEIQAIQAIGAAPDGSGSGSDSGNIVRVDLGASVSVDIDRLQRNFYTTSSCGVCGKSSLEALQSIGATPIPLDGFRMSSATLMTIPHALRIRQETFETTGGLHAAALFSVDGTLAVSREDVGRHNAVDKVLGYQLLQNALPCHDYGLIVSGRASFELVQKAIMAGCSLLAAVGAPSSLAIRLAREFDLTLVGFLRGETFNIYAAEERIY